MDNWIKEYWIKALFGGVISAFGAFGLWVKKKFKQQEMIKMGIQALLRNDIRQAYKECAKKGCCSLDDMEDIQDMYDSYHALGGNGSATRIMDKLKNLPTEKEN